MVKCYVSQERIYINRQNLAYFLCPRRDNLKFRKLLYSDWYFLHLHRFMSGAFFPTIRLLTKSRTISWECFPVRAIASRRCENAYSLYVRRRDFISFESRNNKKYKISIGFFFSNQMSREAIYKEMPPFSLEL